VELALDAANQTTHHHLPMKQTKALTALLALPLVLGMTACSKPPEITASSYEEAMDKCMEESKAELKLANEERARAKADPKSADFDTNPNYVSDYDYPFLLDSEWETIEITQVYCSPHPYKNHKGYWHNFGYLEYLRRPTDKAFGRTEVDRVVVSYGYNWIDE